MSTITQTHAPFALLANELCGCGEVQPFVDQRNGDHDGGAAQAGDAVDGDAAP